MFINTLDKVDIMVQQSKLTQANMSLLSRGKSPSGYANLPFKTWKRRKLIEASPLFCSPHDSGGGISLKGRRVTDEVIRESFEGGDGVVDLR